IVTLTDLRTDRGAWWEVKSNNENVLPDAFITFEEIPGSTRIGRFFVTTDKDIILSLVSQSNI
nr:hypothetical protein [Candidatus Methanofastidiosa archaeon]